MTLRTPLRPDVVLATCVFIADVALLFTLPLLAPLEPGAAAVTPAPPTWQWWTAVAAAAAQSACLVWIRSGPSRTLVAVAAIAFAASLAGLGTLQGIVLIAVVAAAYVATRRRGPGSSWMPWVVAVVLTAAGGTFASLQEDPTRALLAVGAAALEAVIVVGLATLAGALVAGRAAVQNSREQEVISRANEFEARTEAAVAAERTAIARELHDIAAHHLSGIALMSSAISQQIDSDPDAAKQSLADVRAQTRTLLDELRGLVALLRHDDNLPEHIESLAGLESLIPQALQRGLDVSVTTPQGASVGELSQRIGPLGQFAAYRTVQEALANAARHAPGAPCTVELADHGEALEIVVTNGPGDVAVGSAAVGSSTADGDAVGSAGSHGVGLHGVGLHGVGLRGMEERAALTRSTLTYGPTDDGGWRVALRVPRDGGSGATAGEGQT